MTLRIKSIQYCCIIQGRPATDEKHSTEIERDQLKKISR